MFKQSRVILCASISLDGKLDTANPWSAAALRLAEIPTDTVHIPILADSETIGRAPRQHTWVRETARLVKTGAAALDLISELRARQPVHDHPGQIFFGGAPDRILCFGGADIFRALLEAKVVDEIFLTIRPRIDGRQDSPTLSGPPTPEFFPRSLACRLLRMETRDGECLLHYRVVGPSVAER